MKERPIIFSGEMVKAILDGRKTQTRRVAKIPSHWSFPPARVYNGKAVCRYGYDLDESIACPYGAVGDQLWVRESFRELGSEQKIDGTLPYRGSPEICVYRADAPHEGPFRPPIHMPRWASRILLEMDMLAEAYQNYSHAIEIFTTFALGGGDGVRPSERVNLYLQFAQTVVLIAIAEALRKDERA